MDHYLGIFSLENRERYLRVVIISVCPEFQSIEIGKQKGRC